MPLLPLRGGKVENYYFFLLYLTTSFKIWESEKGDESIHFKATDFIVVCLFLCIHIFIPSFGVLAFPS